MISSANRIYSEFVQTEAPRQVSACSFFKNSRLKNMLIDYYLNLEAL